MSPKGRDRESLDELVDDSVLGRRVLLFPPGILAGVGANLALRIGLALLLAGWQHALAGLFVDDPTAGAQAITGLLGVVVIVVTIAVPTFGVVRGHARGHQALLWVSSVSLAVGALSTVGAAAGAVSASAWVFVAAGVLLAVSFATLRSTHYRLLASFYQRLRLRRREG
jgi:hypothetical protein